MGWNGSNERSNKAGNSSLSKNNVRPTRFDFNYKALTVVIVAVVGGGIAAWFFLRPSEQSERLQHPPSSGLTKIADLKPKFQTNALASTNPPDQTSAVRARPKPAPWRNPKLTDEEREKIYEKALKERPLPAATTNRVFSTGLEQVMGWVFTKELGDIPPPLPRLTDHEIVHLHEILNKENPVTENDNEKTAETKRTVDFVKQELKDFVRQGGDPDEFGSSCMSVGLAWRHKSV